MESKKKKRFSWTQGQHRNKDVDVENGLEDTGFGEGEAKTKWESSTDIYKLPNIK